MKKDKYGDVKQNGRKGRMRSRSKRRQEKEGGKRRITRKKGRKG